MFKITWLELLPTPVSTHTSLLLGRLSLGCPFNTLLFKTSLLMYKFLHSGYPKYFVCFLKHVKSQPDGVFLDVQHFATSVYTLHADVFWPLLSNHSERSSKPISSHKHIHPYFCFSWFLSAVLTPAVSEVNDYSFLLFSVLCV